MYFKEIHFSEQEARRIVNLKECDKVDWEQPSTHHDDHELIDFIFYVYEDGNLVEEIEFIKDSESAIFIMNEHGKTIESFKGNLFYK